jgi:hypothetical protein
MMDKKGLSARRGKRQPTFEVPMRKMMVTVVALSAVAFCGPAFAIENPFDVAAVQIVGQTQTFEGGPNGTIVTLQFPAVDPMEDTQRLPTSTQQARPDIICSRPM